MLHEHSVSTFPEEDNDVWNDAADSSLGPGFSTNFDRAEEE
jgi:hypothetical protein